MKNELISKEYEVKRVVVGTALVIATVSTIAVWLISLYFLGGMQYGGGFIWN